MTLYDLSIGGVRTFSDGNASLDTYRGYMTCITDVTDCHHSDKFYSLTRTKTFKITMISVLT